MTAKMANDVLPGATLRQLKEWGYPQGVKRVVPAGGKAFSVIHITGNSKLPSAESETAWRINDPANQNSATFFVNRDGSIVQALGDPLHMDPWANGDVNKPDTSNPRIAAVVTDGVNANERTIVAIENVGYEPGSSITAAQEASCARIIAYYHPKAGVPISRQSIVGHFQLNSVTRPNCPAVNKAVVDRIATKAAGLLTATEEEVSALKDCRDDLERCRARAAKWHAGLLAAEAELEVLKADPTLARIDEIKAKVAALAVDVGDD
jgi:hypothetical protein